MSELDEAVVREFADRGTIWLLDSSANLRDLVAMAAKEIADSLEFERAERVSRSFVPADLHKQEADLLYRVPHRSGGSEVWVYLLVEHQSRPDRLMGYRILSYMVQVWELERQRWEQAKTPAAARRLSPIIPMVFYTGRRRWAGVPGMAAAMEAPAALHRFIPRHESLYLGLHGLPGDALTGSPFAGLLRALQAAKGSPGEMETALLAAAKELEALPPTARAEWSRAMHYLVLLVRHTCRPQDRGELYRVLADSGRPDQREELGTMARTDAQVLVDQGRRQGFKEGRQEGRHEGRQEGRLEGRQEGRLEGRQEGRQEAFVSLLGRMLERRFGPLTAEQRQIVAGLSDDAAATMGVDLLNARSLADLGL